MSYKAFITKISLRPHPNADRLQLATVLGEQVVVGLGMTNNEWVVYFPENGKLSSRRHRTGSKPRGFSLDLPPDSRRWLM